MKEKKKKKKYSHWVTESLRRRGGTKGKKRRKGWKKRPGPSSFERKRKKKKSCSLGSPCARVPARGEKGKKRGGKQRNWVFERHITLRIHWGRKEGKEEKRKDKQNVYGSPARSRKKKGRGTFEFMYLRRGIGVGKERKSHFPSFFGFLGRRRFHTEERRERRGLIYSSEPFFSTD